MPKKLTKIKNLQARAKRAVSEITGSKVKKLVRDNHGEICFVYRVVTDRAPLLLKVRKFSDWPDGKNTTTAHRLISEHGIGEPKLYCFDETRKYFPRGFALLEFVEGENGNDAITKGHVSFEKFHTLLGRVLKNLHKISLPKFGEFYSNKKYSDFLEYKFVDVKKGLDDFKGKNLLPRNIYKDIVTKTENLFAGLRKVPRPCLVHGDPTPDNSLWTKDGKVVLVDWDNAHAGFWLEDLAWLTFFGSHISLAGSLEHRRKILYRTVLRTHGLNGLNLRQIEKLENALHITLASSLLGYYYIAQHKITQFKRTKDRLFTLLK